MYTCMLNKNGGAEADLTVSRLESGAANLPLAPESNGDEVCVCVCVCVCVRACVCVCVVLIIRSYLSPVSFYLLLPLTCFMLSIILFLSLSLHL